ncbi:hypothetical protein KM043_006585 [Ampulex compressa]|nr:hypothetical protein KM043_006585 [Ampulex compressa]
MPTAVASVPLIDIIRRERWSRASPEKSKAIRGSLHVRKEGRRGIGTYVGAKGEGGRKDGALEEGGGEGQGDRGKTGQEGSLLRFRGRLRRVRWSPSRSLGRPVRDPPPLESTEIRKMSSPFGNMLRARESIVLSHPQVRPGSSRRDRSFPVTLRRGVSGDFHFDSGD